MFSYYWIMFLTLCTQTKEIVYLRLGEPRQVVRINATNVWQGRKWNVLEMERWLITWMDRFPLRPQNLKEPCHIFEFAKYSQQPTHRQSAKHNLNADKDRNCAAMNAAKVDYPLNVSVFRLSFCVISSLF